MESNNGSPEWLEQILNDALDTGLSENDFWAMTLAEVNRHIESYIRVTERKNKQRINDLYTLADLCAYSLARLFNESATYEPIDVYFPDLFIEEGNARRQREIELSAEQFLKFAQSFNNRFEDK